MSVTRKRFRIEQSILGDAPIVMAAEEPSRVRGGSTYGGTGDFSGRAVGPITSYVMANAPCRVILTAPPLGDLSVSEVGES